MILQLIDVLIGLGIVYLIFSSIASALMELVEVVLHKKGRLLERGIRELLARSGAAARALDEQGQRAVVQRFYESAPIFSLFRGAYRPQGRNLPSYIPAQRFAQAVESGANAGEAPLIELLDLVRGRLPEAARADFDRVRAECERYFDESMERVAGWYRRFAQAWLLVIGLALSLAANVDTLAIVKTLSLNDDLREQLVQQAASAPQTLAPPGNEPPRAALDRQLALVATLGLPVGWTRDEGRALLAAPDWLGLLAKLLGCLLTALALSFGAPFWFDLLNQLMNLRTSIKPATAADDRAGEASTTKES